MILLHSPARQPFLVNERPLKGANESGEENEHFVVSEFLADAASRTMRKGSKAESVLGTTKCLGFATAQPPLGFKFRSVWTPILLYPVH